LIMMFMWAALTLDAAKRLPQLSLEELSNKKGPSYVPIPFPKTDLEIITDLEYAIKYRIGNKKSFHLTKDMTRGGIEFAKFIEGKRRLAIGAITRVKNRTRYRGDFFFLVDILDDKGLIVARVILEENGNYSETLNGFAKTSIPPFPTKNDIQKILRGNYTNYTDVEIKNISYSFFAGTISNTSIGVESDQGVFYLLHREPLKDRDIFVLVEIKKFNNQKDLSEFVKRERLIKENQLPFLLDEINLELYILKHI